MNKNFDPLSFVQDPVSWAAVSTKKISSMAKELAVLRAVNGELLMLCTKIIRQLESGKQLDKSVIVNIRKAVKTSKK